MKAKYTVHSCARTRLSRAVDLGKGLSGEAFYDGLVVELLPTEHPESGTIKLALGADAALEDTFKVGSTVVATFKKEG